MQPPAPLNSDDAPYPEPVFSGVLLFWLPAILSLAAIAIEGIHFGYWAAPDRLTLPMLHSLENGAPRGDALTLITPHWSSPFWQLFAVCNSGNASLAVAFSLLAIACRLLSVAAIFRLTERFFLHPLTAALAAILWVLVPALGGIALHHAAFSDSDLACALTLWTLVLWQEGLPRWGLLAGLAACVDTPSASVLFGIVWLLGWWRAKSGETTRTTGEKQVRALLWFVFGAAPVALEAFAIATNSPGGAAARTLAAWWLGLQSVHDAATTPELGLSLWVLATGAWCWKRSLRGAATARAVAPLVWTLVSLTSLGLWLGANGIPGALPQVTGRLAPLTATLMLIAVARVYERAAARRGGLGFVLLWMWAWLAVTLNATFFLVGGVIALEAIAAAQRRLPGMAWSLPDANSPRPNSGADPQSLPGKARRFVRAGAARWALTIFVLAFFWRGRAALLARLPYGAALCPPQPASWLQVQLWARDHTAPGAVFLGICPGFREFSERAVFLDQDDSRWRGCSPLFTAKWRKRFPLADSFWRDGGGGFEKLAYRLRAAGVTHIVVPAGRPMTRTRATLLYRNASWAIYKLR